MMTSRAVYQGLINNKELLPLPSHQKKKPQDAEIKGINKKLEQQMEDYMKQISHPYYFAEANGFSGLFEAPPEAEKKDVQEFRQERREEARAREARFAAALRSLAEAGSNTFEEVES